MRNATKFSILGSGYYVKLFDTQHPLYNCLKIFGAENMKSILYDVSAFAKLNIADEKGIKYKSFYDDVPTKSHPIYCLDYFSRLEIKRETHTINKLVFKDLLGIDSLFTPEYKTTKTELNFNGLLVLEFDKGNFGSASIKEPLQQLSQLHFNLVYIPQLQQYFVELIYFNDKIILLKKLDTLNFGNSVFVN